MFTGAQPHGGSRNRGRWDPSLLRPGVLVGLGGWACCLTSREGDKGLLRERMGSADTQKSLTPSGHNFKTPKKASNSKQARHSATLSDRTPALSGVSLSSP